jgi:hypothetical protein
MKIAVFLDGRPGHEKQSLAIISALQQMHEIEIQKIPVTRKSVPEYILDICKLLAKRDGGCDYHLDDVDLLIGTGSKTHLPILASKKKIGVPAVTCMTPDLLLRWKFDLCFVPRHDGIAEAANIFLTDGPPVLPIPPVPRETQTGLILLGGEDHESHYWNTSEVLDSIERTATEYPEMEWTVSSSPRTPDDTVKKLLELEKKLRNVSFFHYLDTPKGWVEEHYARSSFVLVTADSMSMIYEALTAGCSVGIIPVTWKKKKNKFQKSIDYLFERGLVTDFSRHDESVPERNSIAVFDEAKRCAGEISARFFNGKR